MKKEQIQEKITNLENLINISQKVKDEAIVARTASQTKLEASLDSLKKHGITLENAEAEVTKLNNEIEQLISEVENSIPMDLLKELKKI